VTSPYPADTSCHADDLGGNAGVEAVHEGDADVDFGGLAVGVSCGDAFAKGLPAADPLTGSRLRANDERFRLDAAAGVVRRPARPECPSLVPRRAQGVVAGACGLAVLFARPPVLSDRDD
jgi:hypothetical protein